MLFFQRFLYHLPFGHYLKIYFIFVASFLSGYKDTKKKMNLANILLYFLKIFYYFQIF